jgi:hypothetical protein
MTTSKQELIQLIDIHLKKYTWKINDFYKNENEIWITINTNGEDYDICIYLYQTWEKNKKRIRLNIEQNIRECMICNEIKKLTFCYICLNQYCYLCEAHIIVKNNGIPICPFCRDGEKQINVNSEFNDRIKKYTYKEALKIIESNIIH